MFIYIITAVVSCVTHTPRQQDKKEAKSKHNSKMLRHNYTNTEYTYCQTGLFSDKTGIKINYPQTKQTGKETRGWQAELQD
jgi:hypothetical protein